MNSDWRTNEDSRLRLVAIALLVLLVSSAIGLVALHSSAGITETSGLVRGWDFQQFYLAGRTVVNGQADRLYDVDAFQSLQRSLFPIDDQNIPFLPLYPPTVALLVSPLAGLGYLTALSLWWLVQIVAVLLACRLLWSRLDFKSEWKWVAVLGAAGFYPLLVALRAGQMTPLLLAIAIVGFSWIRDGRQRQSGWVLSLLFLKPQIGAGLLLWVLLTRRWSVAFGMVGGGAAQLALAAVALGPEVVGEYFSFATVYLKHSQYFTFPAGWSNSFAYLSDRVLNSLGAAEVDVAAKAIHALVIVLASVLVVCIHRSSRSADDSDQIRWVVDASVAMFFVCLFPPHLLVYDLSLLAFPLICLLSVRRFRRIAIVLFVGTCALAMPLYAWLDVHLAPLLVLWALVQIGEALRSGAAAPARSLSSATEF